MVLGGGPFGRQSGHKGGPLGNGIGALLKEILRELSRSFYYEDTGEGNVAIYERESSPSPDNKFACTFILDFQLPEL